MTSPCRCSATCYKKTRKLELEDRKEREDHLPNALAKCGQQVSRERMPHMLVQSLQDEVRKEGCKKKSS